VIRINLLPVDLRRGSSIPTKVLAAAFAAALAVSGAIGWFGIVYFGDLGNAEQALLDVEAKLEERNKRVAYHDKLESNRKDYATRVQTIQDIGKSRRLWSKFLDELIDVTNNNGDTERHLAWFGGLAVKGDLKKGPTVSMPAMVQDEDKARLANFHDDLEAAPFWKELSFKSDPSYKTVQTLDRVPPLSMSFPLTLQFAPRTSEPAKPKTPAAPAAPPKTPANK